MRFKNMLNMLNMLNIEGGRYICIAPERYQYGKYRGGSIYICISGYMHIYQRPSIFSIFSIIAYEICKYAKYRGGLIYMHRSLDMLIC